MKDADVFAKALRREHRRTLAELVERLNAMGNDPGTNPLMRQYNDLVAGLHEAGHSELGLALVNVFNLTVNGRVDEVLAVLIDLGKRPATPKPSRN